MAQPTLTPPPTAECAPASALPEWRIRTLGTGRRQAYIPRGEVFAGAAVLDIVLDDTDPGVGWPRVLIITRGRPGSVRRLIIAAVDELDIDLAAATASATAQAAEMILNPLGAETTGLHELTGEQRAQLRTAAATLGVAR